MIPFTKELLGGMVFAMAWEPAASGFISMVK